MWTSRLVFVSLYGMLFVLGLTNVIVLLIVAGYKSMRTVTNTLIFNLCFADLVYISFLPIVITFQLLQDWKFGLAVCKLFYIAESTAKYASVYFVSVLSFDRYLAICHPHWCRRYRNVSWAVAISLVGWTVTAAMMAPIYLYSTVVTLGPGTRTCTVVWPSASYFLPPFSFEDDEEGAGFARLSNFSNFTEAYSNKTFCKNQSIDWYSSQAPTAQFYFVTLTFVFCFGLPAVAVLFFYIKVVQQLVRASNRAGRLKKKYEKTYRKVSRMVLAVVAGYIICWTPYWVQFMLVTYITNFRVSDILKIIFNSIHLLPYLNCAVNPILYSLLTENFKNILIELFPCLRYCGLRPSRFRRNSVNSIRRENTWRKTTASSTHSMSTRHRTSTTVEFDHPQNGGGFANEFGKQAMGSKRNRGDNCMRKGGEKLIRRDSATKALPSFSHPLRVVSDVSVNLLSMRPADDTSDLLTETTFYVV